MAIGFARFSPAHCWYDKDKNALANKTKACKIFIE